MKEELCEERTILGGGESLIAEPESTGDIGKNPFIDPERSRSCGYSRPFMNFFGNCVFCALEAVTF